ncbi:serine/threonine-protein kinase [Saccharothrix ecbatanensis]|uniref:non-specific serine/threonine protein kinase n=1 Tax=Saccharothrix ecbatanensis TaxID=1105145 RepID=A0A7W9HLB5_9PSEU|nr:serine/threonine-protein kinase [Saccharothrix ecbatanensis]MBB5804423.1 serine/threonine-protein kinase [Saccharothrix ecbatanensis]
MTVSANVVAALPQYDIGPQIGRGGMGVVYAGVHRPLGRPVAVKRLPGVLAEDERMSARFAHEARLLARLDHPHIVPVYDYVQDRGEHLLVMEKLDGGTVWSKFTASGVTPASSCAYGLAMLSGLHAAHEAGVLHLDVKPKNLLFTAGGVLKVADFGISQVVSEGATLVTHAGQVLGTPAYLSPEQALGNPLSPAADVYGAATVLYELVSGRLPFDSGGGALAMIQRHVYQQPRQLVEVPDPLARVIMRGLERDPQARYRNAETFAVDLAAAAAALFGPDWLLRLGTPVHLSPQVAASVTRPLTTSHATSHAPRETLNLPVRATLTDSPATPPVQLGAQTLVPAAQVLASPKPARWFTLAAALAGVLMLAVPFTISNRDLQVLRGDLSKPVTVSVAGGDPATARLALTVAGITLADVPAVVAPATGAGGETGSTGETGETGSTGAGGAGGAQVEVPVPLTFELPGATRWIVGGAAVATVTADGKSQEYSLQPDTHPLISIMGAGSVVLLLFALAYLESILRSLRRRQAGTGAVIVAAPLGFALGVAVWLLPSVLLRHTPDVWPALVCGGLGVAAAVCTAVATRRAALR